MANGLKKQGTPYQIIKNCDNVSTRLDTVPALGGQTDKTGKQYRTLHALHADT